MRKLPFVSLAAMALLAMAISVPAYANLVVNGDFELTTSGPNFQIGFNTNEVGWSVPDPHAGSSYFFVWAPGIADTIGAFGQYGFVGLWGPGNGVANGLPPASPNGGNFIGSDGAFQTGAISQLVTGLTPGASYTLTFEWATAQESDTTGASTNQWVVSFGGQTFKTVVINLPSQGFSGWMQQTFTVTADSTSDVLSFLSQGAPLGAPPFALLDSVDLEPTTSTTPEPNTMLLLGSSLVGAFGLGRRYYAKKRL